MLSSYAEKLIHYSLHKTCEYIGKKIKESFPVPREQTILWADYVVKTNRVGGIVVTNKGVFIKTLVTVFD